MFAVVNLNDNASLVCVWGGYEKVGGVVTWKGSQSKTGQLRITPKIIHYPVTGIENLLSFSR